MTRKIFRSIVLVAASVLIVGMAILFCVLYSYFGTVEERELQDAVQVWYRRRYGVELDPRTEVTSLLGS